MPRSLPSHQEALQILAAKRSRPPRRPPPSAGKALARTIKALGEKFGGAGGEALGARWSEIVGRALARRTEPIRVIRSRAAPGAILELRVEGPSAALVAHQAQDILARVNLFLGVGAVGRLRIVQGPLTRRQGAPEKPRRRRPTGPLDAAAEQALADSLAGFADGRLKAALERLGREVLRDQAS